MERVAVEPVAVTAFGRKHPLFVQIVRFMLVGGLGTGANALFYVVLRTWMEPVPANLVALIASTFVSTEANRRFTFGGAVARQWRNYVQNGGTVLFYAFYSSTVLVLVGALVTDPSPTLEAAAVACASLLGGTCRFLVMRYWVFRQPEGQAESLPDRTVRTP